MLIFSVDPEQNVPMENHERGISPLLRTVIIHNYQMGTIITVRKFNLLKTRFELIDRDLFFEHIKLIHIFHITVNAAYPKWGT